jgi:hypothetical protein
MRHEISFLALRCAAILAVVLFGWQPGPEGAAQQPNPPAEATDIEILGHGPIHEAFAQPTAETLESTIIINKKPPEPVEELPPDVKPEGDNVVWIPGYWAFDQERNDFIWISGFWRNVPPNRVWIAGYWVQEGVGYRWVTGYWSEVTTTQVYYPPPPELIDEASPPAPNADSFYVSGIWVYRDTRFLWRPGYWTPYRPGWLWTQPHYVWTPGGYLFVDGYWDYDFQRRGVLFAPAYFGPRYFAANRYYRPSFALSTSLLYGSLFVRPSAGFYYFGDYYAPRYAGLGYTPWLDYRYHGRFADPAWSYYAWNNRGVPRWQEQTRATYAARQSGASPAPPRRVNAQPTAPQPANANQNVNLVVPVQQLQARNDFKFRAVGKEERAVIERNANETRQLVKSRQNVEGKLDVKATRIQPVRAELALPKAATTTQNVQVPPPPIVPNVNPKATPPKAKAPKDPGVSPNPQPAIPPKGTDKAPPKGTDKTPPKIDDKTPSKVSPPITPPKGKDPFPKVDPKAIPKTTPPVPITPQPPKTLPAPTPKIEPKPLPPPKAAPPAPTPPQPPKTLPAPPPKFEPKPAPPPKAAPAPIPPPPKSVPAPIPKIEPKAIPAPKPAPPVVAPPKAPPAPRPPELKPAPAPAPKPLPAPKAPPPQVQAPKAAPLQPNVAPRPAPKVERTVPAPQPENPKKKGKEKD